MNNKIVIVCQSFGYLIKDIANAYLQAGIDVTLMGSNSSFSNIKDELKGEVNFSPVIEYDKSSYKKRIFTWVVCAIQMWIKIFFRYRNRRLLIVSNPPLAPLLPRILRNDYSILIWDVYPDVILSQEITSRDSLIIRQWEKINKKVYAKAKHIFAVSPGMKNCLSKYVNKKKIVVVPLWPNGKMHRINKADNLFIKEQGLEEKFIVLYSGNLGNTHRIDVLLDVAQLVNDDDIEFLLIGEGGKKKEIEERIAKEQIKNIRVLPYQTVEMLPHSLSSADIAVITLDTSSSQLSVPSKTFNLMAVGAPLLCIASPESELGNIVNENEVGEIYSPTNLKEIAQYIIKLKCNPAVREKYSQNSLKASRKYTSDNSNMFIV